LWRRRRILKFFGLHNDSRRISVYLSTVFVKYGGSTDFKGQTRAFTGPAVPAYELALIEPIATIFTSSIIDSLPKTFTNWLSNNVHWSLGDITPLIYGSPYEKGEVNRGSIISIGSQYYNSAGDLYTDTCETKLKMNEVNSEIFIEVVRGRRKGDIFKPRTGHKDDLAIVEKVCVPEIKSTIFFASGLGIVGTTGAVLYLAENWSELYKEFGSKSFAICLRFQDIYEDTNAVARPEVIARL